MKKSLLLLLILLTGFGGYSQYPSNIPLNDVHIYSDFPMLMADEMLKNISTPKDRASSLGTISIAYFNTENLEKGLVYYSKFKDECKTISDDTARVYLLAKFSNQLIEFIPKQDILSLTDECIKFIAPNNNLLLIEISALLTELGQFEKAIELLSFIQFGERQLAFDYSSLERSKGAMVIAKILDKSVIMPCVEKQFILEKLSTLDLGQYVEPGNIRIDNAFDSLFISCIDDCSLESTIAMTDAYHRLFNSRMTLVIPFNEYHKRQDTAAMKTIIHQMESLIDSLERYSLQGHLFGLFRSYIKIGEIDKAVALESQFADDAYLRKETLIELAEVLFELSRPEEALDKLRQADTMNSNDIHSWDGSTDIRVIRLYDKYGYSDKSSGHLQKMISQVENDESTFGKHYTIEKIIKYLASNGKYEEALKLAFGNLDNYGPSSPRIEAIYEMYNTAFNNEDTIYGMKILQVAKELLRDIEHPHQANAYVEYTATKYAEIGQIDQALTISHQISSNVYWSIFDFTQGLFDIVENDKSIAFTDRHFQELVTLLTNESSLRWNANNISYLISKYDSINQDFVGGWFESEMENIILNNSLPELTKKDRGKHDHSSYNLVDHYRHVFIDFIRYNLLYQLYKASGNKVKEEEVLNSATDLVHQRTYKSQHIEWMIRIDNTHGQWGWWY